VKYKQFIRILRDAGFYFERKKGSHEMWSNGMKMVVVPRRNGYDMNKMLCKKILEQAGITV
jgi:predicted RNA binding protein YcfA (HicA-like mRNA interferase family)